MRKNYRFRSSSTLGKVFLRNWCKKNISREISSAPKKGLGVNLFVNFKDKSLEEEANKAISETNFFSQYPFNNDVKKILLDQKTHEGNRWSAYCLISTHISLEKINERKYIFQSV